jgi:glycerol uptake facilitator protein
LSIIGAELIGTAILIILGDGVVAAVVLAKSKAENSGWIVITWGWGLAVAIAVYAVVHYDGAHLNPAVTLGFLINGNIHGAGTVIKYLVGEMGGAMIGAAVVFAAYYQHFAETEDPGLKLAVFCTGPAIRNPIANFTTEAVGTFMLMFGILAIVGTNNNPVHPTLAAIGPSASGIQPLLIGLLILAIGLSLGGPTGYAINPARDLGPRIMHAILPIPGKGPSDWGYAWIPVVAPLVGGAIGALAYGAFYP